jgi:NitT/TauT family transport system substrate-binding protein
MTNPTRRRRGRRHLARSLAALLAVAVTATGCLSDPAEEAEEPAGGGELTQLRIATSLVDSIPYMTILQVAADQGWFREAGLDVTVINAGGGGDTTRLVTSGQAEIGLAGPDAIYKAATSPGSTITIMGAWFQHNIVVWVAADPDTELQGARLGVTGAGSTGEFLVHAMQAARPDLNLEPVVVAGLGANWAAAKAGEIDGAYSAQPQAQALFAEGGVPLVRPSEVIGDLPMNLAAVSTAFAEENPDAVRAFWEVADRAFTYIKDDPDAAAAELNKIINMDLELLRTALREMAEAPTGFSIAVDCAGFANLADQWAKTGLVTEPVDWATVMDQQYLPEDARCDEFGATG